MYMNTVRIKFHALNILSIFHVLTRHSITFPLSSHTCPCGLKPHPLSHLLLLGLLRLVIVEDLFLLVQLLESSTREGQTREAAGETTTKKQKEWIETLASSKNGITGNGSITQIHKWLARYSMGTKGLINPQIVYMYVWRRSLLGCPLFQAAKL